MSERRRGRAQMWHSFVLFSAAGICCETGQLAATKGQLLASLTTVAEIAGQKIECREVLYFTHQFLA